MRKSKDSLNMLNACSENINTYKTNTYYGLILAIKRGERISV